MNPLRVAPDITLRSLTPDDALAVHTLIAANREHLDSWLRWSAALRTESDVRAFLDQFTDKEARGDGFHLGLWVGPELAGGTVCWYIHRQNRNAEVGYWLGTAFLGRGLVTRAVGAVIGHLFDAESLHRIEMQCGLENTRSRAVAERLGFRLEGVRRESHWISTRFVDHAVYGLLAQEWRAMRVVRSPAERLEARDLRE